MAGSETNSHVVTWCMCIPTLSCHLISNTLTSSSILLCASRFEISQHPEVEAKIVAELDKAGLLCTAEHPQPRTMTFTDISALPYLSGTIKVLNPGCDRLET